MPIVGASRHLTNSMTTPSMNDMPASLIRYTFLPRYKPTRSSRMHSNRKPGMACKVYGGRFARPISSGVIMLRECESASGMRKDAVSQMSQEYK